MNPLHTTPSPQVAYFCMEFGLSNDIPTYSGGLGMLAGDTLRAAADLGVPMVGVALLYRKGYFKQEIADGKQVEGAVRHAMALGTATAVFDRVLRPAMAEVGQRWHDGVFSIGQEHMATQIVESAASSMLRLVQHDDAERTVVVACFADDTHSLPLYGFSLHMAVWGHRVVRLGTRTPPHAIRQAVEEIDPELVGLSVTVTPPPHRARELVEEYASACGETPWVVGGAAAPELAELIEQQGGVVVEGYDPRTIRRTVESLASKHRKRKRTK